MIDVIFIIQIFKKLNIQHLFEDTLKHNLEDLANNVKIYEKILESISEGVVLFDRNYKYLLCNEAFSKIIRVAKKDLEGKTMFDFYPDIKETEFFTTYEKVFKTGERATIFSDYVFDDGSQRWFENKVIPLPGEVKRIFVIIRDITDRQLAELRLNILSLHSEIMANMAEGVYLVRTSDGIITYTNPKLEKMFGYSQGGMVGKHVSIVNAPTDRSPQEIAMEIMKTLEDKGEWHGEVKNIKKDGTLFWCYANVSTFDHPEHGRVWVSVHADITERKKIENEREEALRQAEFYKDLFAHDMNNILHFIISSAEFYSGFQNDSETSKKFGEIAQVIKQQALRGSKLI